MLAHNGSGYDFPVLYPAIYSTPDMETRRTISTTYRGTALIGIRIGRGDNAIRFVDTWLHFSTKLSDTVKMFGLADEMKASGLSGGKVTKIGSGKYTCSGLHGTHKYMCKGPHGM